MAAESSPAQGRSLDSLLRPLFLWSLPFTFLYFWLPIVSKDLGANALGVGGLFSAFTLATLVLRPIVGRALDRFGRRIFLVIALLIYAASMTVFAAADSLGSLYAARLIQGVGSALLWSAVYTIVTDLAPRGESGKALGQVNQTITRGGFVGMFIALTLSFSLRGNTGWRLAFAAFGVTSLVAAWLTVRNLPEARRPLQPNQEKSPAAKRLWRLLGLALLVGVPQAMLDPIYLIYLQDKFGLGMENLAWAFLPAGVAAAFLSTRLGALSDRFGRVPMLVLGLAAAGIVSLLMPQFESLITLAALFALTTILWAIVDPARTAMVVDMTGEQHHGTAYGLYDMAQNLGFTIGPVLGGLAYDSLGRAVPFYLEGLLLILCTGWALAFLRHAPQHKISGS